jgi:KDO2-lipid IV(A) lauroyltransferase
VAKKRSALADYAVYLVVRFAVCVLQILSWGAGRKVADVLAWIVYKADARHRRIAMENLRQAFPGWYTDEQLDRIVRAVFRHFCGLIIEMVLIPRKMHIKNHKRHLIPVNEKELLKIVLDNRPVLLLTGHFGNWELAGYGLGFWGFRTYGVARSLDNPHLDRFLRRFRERTGQALLSKKGEFDRMTEVLATGGILGTLADQDAGQRGLFVDFFGRSASTHKAIALMALEQRVPILVTGTYKIAEPLCYKIVIQDVIFPEDYTDRSDAIKAITQRFTSSLEQLIRQAPEQYFWVHNRWKHQPVRSRRRAA